jgi:hypothetical protein
MRGGVSALSTTESYAKNGVILKKPKLCKGDRTWNFRILNLNSDIGRELENLMEFIPEVYL